VLNEAIILAGGFGTRLRSVINDVPKPMAPVNEKPFLDYLLQYLSSYGIKKIVLSVGFLSEKIIEQYGNQYKGIPISYSIEKEPLGTGGGIRLAMQQCTGEHVLVLNGDSFFDINLKSFYNHHEEMLADCSLALRKADNAARYGTIELGDLDLITAFKEKNGEEKPGTINAGIYLLNRETFLEETPSEKNFSIEKDFFETHIKQLNLYGFCYDGYFIDIGIPEDFNKAQNDFKAFKY